MLTLEDCIISQLREDGRLLIGCASTNPRRILEIGHDLNPGDLLDEDVKRIWVELVSRRAEIDASDDNGIQVLCEFAIKHKILDKVFCWMGHSIIDGITYWDLAKQLVQDIGDLKTTLQKVNDLAAVDYG